MYTIDVTTENIEDRVFSVTVSAATIQQCNFRVRVSPKTMDEFDLSVDDLPQIINQAFVFLLERESPEAILPSFELMTIATHFPEFTPSTS